MNFKEYLTGVKRTESSLAPLSDSVRELGLTDRLYHGIVGICTEIGEIAEAYDTNGTVDYINVAEELGDAFWYAAIILDESDCTEIEINTTVEPTDMSKFPLKLSVLSSKMLDTTKKTMFYGKQFNT